jgi:beta-lactamase class A
MLSKIIKEASLNFNGTMGIAVKHLNTGEHASLNGDNLFPTASVRKIPIIIELYRQVEAGIIDLDQKVLICEKDKGLGSGILKELSPGFKLSIRDIASLMMILSDNTAADIILGKVGLKNVNTTLCENGFIKTKLVANSKEILFNLIGLDNLPKEEKTLEIFRKKGKGATLKGTWSIDVENNNITTPNEMLRMLEMVYKCEIVSPKSSKDIMEIMSRCQTGGYRISKYLPRETVAVADKTGELPGIRNDSGIINLLDTNETYILSCFTKGARDIYEAEETIAQISKRFYEYFTR